MILDDEAAALYECFYRGAGPSVARQEHRREDIEGYIDGVETDRELLPEIQRYFDIRSRDICSHHGTEFATCGCGDGRREEIEFYVPDPERIVSGWVERIHDRGIFRGFEEKQVDEERWDIRARYGETDVRFIIFLNKNELERYNFEPHSFEFGVTFADSRLIYDEDYIYSWYAFLENGFEEGFSKNLQRYRNAISADFAEYEPIVDFRARVRQSIREYLQTAGYTIRREVGDVCPEIQRYGIESGDGDFVGINDNSKIIICHCSKSDGWHVHHIRGGLVESAEALPEIDHMLGQLESKIKRYEAISENKETVSNFMSALAALFSITTFVLLLNNTGILANFFNQRFPDANLGFIGVVLLLLDAVAAIVLVVIVVKPFARDMWFDWSIEPFNSEEGGRWRQQLRNLSIRSILFSLAS